MAAKIDILGPVDQKNYEQVVADLVAETKLDKAAYITEIAQVERPGDAKYIGAWLTVEGPTVVHSSGPDAAWRKYIYVSADWEEERIFDDIGKLYDFLAAHVDIFRRSMYTRKADRYEHTGVSTFNVARWGQRHASE